MKKKKNTKTKKKVVIEKVTSPVVECEQKYFSSPAGRSVLSVVALIAVFALLSAGWIIVGWQQFKKQPVLSSNDNQLQSLQQELVTLKKEQANLATELKSLRQTSIPIISIDKQSGYWIIFQNNREVARISVGESGESPSLTLVKQTLQNAYLGYCPGGLGGAYLFEACPYGLTRLDLKTHELKDMTPSELLIFGDVSPDENWLVWKDSQKHTVVLQSIVDKTEKSFVVPKEFEQFGNIRFSPDGTKIAYAAANGIDWTAANGVVQVINIASAVQTTVARSLKEAFEVYGWKDADTVDY